MEEDISLISAHPVMEKADLQKVFFKLKQELVVAALELASLLVIHVEISDDVFSRLRKAVNEANRTCFVQHSM